MKQTMENNLNDVIGKLTDFLKSEAKTETVIGQQFELGDFKCVPVIGVGVGLGVGGGEGATNGKSASGPGLGGAAGLGMGPIGFLVTKGADIQFIAVSQSKGLSAVFEKLPGLMEKYFDKNKKEEKAGA